MEEMKLFYLKPSEKWEETLPIGNGKLGAMIWGGINNERLGLNEDSIWSCYYHDKNNYSAGRYLDEVRRLIIDEKYVEAEKHIQDTMLGEYNESYLPLGDLHFNFLHGQACEDYKRTLDIDNSMVKLKYCRHCLWRLKVGM